MTPKYTRISSESKYNGIINNLIDKKLIFSGYRYKRETT
jgi:hypothetical protein